MKPKSSLRRFFPLASIVFAGAFASSAMAQTWNQTAAGTYDWNNSGNWTATFPNAVGATAGFGIDLLGNQTINLNQAITVGTLNLGDTTGATYNTTTIAGNGGSLILDVSTGSATIAKTTAGNNVTDVISANIQINDNLIVNNTSAGGITISGDITQSGGTRTLTKSGAGTLTLSGNNSYTGLTTINAGTLLLGASNRISDSSGVTIKAGTFDLGGFSETVGAFTTTDSNPTITNGTLTASSYTLQSGTISAVLAGAGNLGKTVGSSNTVTLSGANTYTGTTTISSGTLALGIAENVGVSGPLGVGGTISFTGPRTVGNFSGTLQYSASNTYDYSSRFSTAADQAFKLNTNGQNVTWATPLNSTGGWLVKQGTGTLTLGSGTHTLDTVLMNVSNENTGTLSLSNGTILNASTAVIIGGDGEAALGVNSNTAALTTAASGSVTIRTARLGVGFQKANTGSFTLGSGGSLTLEGTSGGRTLLQVGYSISSDGSARTATGTMDLSAGAASLKLSQLVVGQQTSTNQNGGIGTLTLSSNAANHLDISGTGNVVVIGSQASNNNGAPVTTGTLTIGNLNATSSITSTNNGTAILLGEKLGTSTAAVTGNLNLNGGTLTITTTGAAIAGGAGTANLNLSGGVTLKAGASSTDWIQNLDTAAINSGGATIDTNTYNLGISQAFSGAGGLTKAGSGTLTISNSQSYTGATNVSGGTLVVNGNISTSSLTTVNSGATLGGTGTIGDLTVLAGATHAPGNSPGIQTVDGNYNMAGTLSLEIEGLTPGTGHDQVSVINGGGVTLSGILDLNFTGSYANGDMIFILLNDSTDPISDVFTDALDVNFLQGDVVANYGGFDWTISYEANSTGASFTGGNDVALLATTAIPEPGAALLGSIGLLLIFRRRRI